jgi:hypothetical protein
VAISLISTHSINGELRARRTGPGLASFGGHRALYASNQPLNIFIKAWQRKRHLGISKIVCLVKQNNTSSAVAKPGAVTNGEFRMLCTVGY